MNKPLPDVNIGDQKLIPIGEAADFLGVSVDTLRRWDKSGKIKSTRPNGKDRFFSLNDLERVKVTTPLGINAAAKHLDLSPSTLRRLEEKGLINPERDENGKRLYDYTCLQKFVNSRYFLSRRSVVDKVLRPLEKPQEKEPVSTEKAYTKTDIGSENEYIVPKDRRDVLSTLVFEQQRALRGFSRIRSSLVFIGLSLSILFVFLVSVITILFLTFPEETAGFLGYRYSPGYEIQVRAGAPGLPSGLSEVSDSLTSEEALILGASKDNNSETVAHLLRPFSKVSLKFVRIIDEETYEEITEMESPKDIQDIFTFNEEGDLVFLYNVEFTDDTVIKISEEASGKIVENLNAEYVRGHAPGVDTGDLAVFGGGGSIIGLTGVESVLSDGAIIGGIGGIILDNSITDADLADNSIFSAAILDETITEDDLADDAVTSDKIDDGTIEEGDLADDSITSDKIADGEVGVAELADILAFGASDLLNLSAITHSASSPRGLLLPQVSSASPVAPSTGEGYLSYDTSGDQVLVYTGASWTQVGSGDITNVAVGNGLAGGGASGDVTLDLDVTTTGTTATTFSNSGLETASDGLSLLRGCADNQIIKWDTSTSRWQCEADSGGGGGSMDVEEGDVLVVSGASAMDFLATDFATSESPAGEANVSIDYSNSKIVRSDQIETVTGGWTFNTATTLFSNGVRIGTDSTDYLIDDASNGAASGTLYIGNESILASGDIGVSIQGYDVNTTALGSLINLDSEVTGTLPVSNGGTGATSFTSNGILYGNVSGALQVTAAGDSGYVLYSNSGTPSWLAQSSINAGQVDGIEGASFLRSDSSDEFESGNTLTLSGGLDSDGDVSFADTSIVLDGVSTNFAVTGNLFFNTDDLIVEKSSGFIGIGTTAPSTLLDVSGGTFTAGTVDINGGAIDGTAIGANSASTGAFSTLTSTGISTIGNDSATVEIDSSDWNISTTGVITGVSFDANGTGNAISNIEDGDLAANTLTTSSLAATLTFANADLVDFSSLTIDSATEGLKLPQGTDCTSQTAEGSICWDSDNDKLYVGNAAGMTEINSSAGASTLQQAYEAGATVSVTSGEGALSITATSANMDILVGNSTDTGDFRIWDGAANWLFIDEDADTLALGTAAGSGITIGGAGITTTNSGALTVSETFTAGTVVISGGGAMNNVAIGLTTPAPGAFTTLTSTGVSTIGNDSATVEIDSSDWNISTTGVITGVSFDANGAGNAISNIENSDLAADTLDFTSLSDGLTLDVTTTIALGTADLNFEAGVLFLDGSANYVGIGTTLPSTLLDVSGGTFTAGTVDINGGAIDGTAIGANSASTGAFSTLTSTGISTIGNDSATVEIDSSDWNISTTGAITGVSFDANGVGNAISNIEDGDLAANTLTTSSLAATLTFANADLVDFSSLTIDSATEGLKLPQGTDCTGQTAEGSICWDSDNDKLYVGNAAGMTEINSSAGASTLQQAYEAGATVSVTSGEGALSITATSANMDILVGNSTDTGDFRIWDGAANWLFIDEDADTLALGTAAGSGITIGGAGITTTNSGALTVSETFTAGTVVISGGGAMNNVAIGLTTPAPGAFTTLTSTGVSTIGNDSATVEIDSSDWNISTTGVITGVSFDANGAGNAISNIENSDLAADTLDFTSLSDGLTLDVTTTIALGTADLNFEAGVLFLDGSANYVGIGTTLPSTLLDVSGGTFTAGTVDINGGAIDGTAIGANSASTGAFSTLTSTGISTIGNDSATVEIDSSDWNISTTGAITGVSFDANGVGNAISNIEDGDLAANTLTTSSLAATLTFANADLVDFSSLTIDSATEGLKLPQGTDCTSQTAEGSICWDSDNDKLYVGNAAGMTEINSSAGASTLQQAYEAGATVSVTSGEGALSITATSANMDILVGNSTDTGDFRIWDGAANWLFIDEDADTLALGTAAGSGITIGGAGITTTNSGALTVSETFTAGTVVISGGGAMNNVAIGLTTPAPGAFTTLTSTGVSTIGNDSATVEIDSSDWNISTTGVITGVSFDANGAGNAISNIENSDLAADTLDFTSLSDGLTLDVTTTIALGTADLNFEAGVLFLDGSANYVGIGTTLPSTLLDVSGGTFTAGTVDINGGAIDGTAIGANSASTGAFSTLTSTGISTIGNDSATVEIDSSDWNISTTGAITGVSFDANGVGNAISNIENSDLVADTLDFTALSDTLALDADTSIAFGAAEELTVNKIYTDATSENGLVLNFTALDTTSSTTAQYGLYLDNIASTEGMDAMIVIDNSDADDVVGAAIKTIDAGGTFTSLFDIAGTLISTSEFTILDSGIALSELTNSGILTAGTVVISGGGAMNNVAIGLTTPAPGAFTTLTSTGVSTIGNDSATVEINSSAWDISDTGVITGATGISTTTVTASSAIAANGGITFDNSTDTLGAFTAAGSIDLNTSYVLTNIGSGDTDFSGTGGLTLADTLAVNSGGVTITAGALAVNSDSITSDGTLTINASSVVRLGDATNHFDFDETSGPDYNGTARPAKRVTLIPEFPGATLTGDGANNTGTMTSDFCSNGNTNPPDINIGVCATANDLHNYYSWTAQATNDYDIWVNWQVPMDFDEFNGATAISFYGWRTSVSDSVTVTLYDDADTVCGSGTAISGTVAQWNATNYADPTGCDVVSSGNIGPGDTVTFRIQLSVGVNDEYARMGKIEIDYLARF